MGYDAFISYSHAADGRLAPALQAGMQRLAKPWNRRRALHVFRDETGLSTNPHLWSSIEAALDASEWFVLLASPEAAGSDWVNREITHWRATKSADRILPVVTDGTWEWDAARNDFVSGSTAVPDALRGALRDEPRHLDLRWARTETDLDLRNSQFRSAIADLASPMHGIAKDDLEGEDIRQHRRARRLARGGVSVLSALVVIAVVTSAVALSQRNRADSQERHAEARGLAAVAYARSTTELDQALLLGIEGIRIEDTPATRYGLISALGASPALVRFRQEFGDRIFFASASRDHKRVVTQYSDGQVRVWDLQTGRPVTPPVRAHSSPVIAAALSPDGRTLATGALAGDEIRVFDADTGKPKGGPIALPGRNRVQSLAFNPSGHEFAATRVDGTVLRFASPGAAPIGGPIEIPWAAGGNESANGLVYTPDGRTIVVATDSRVAFVDVATGVVRPGFIDAPTIAPQNLAVSRDGQLLAVGGYGGAVALYDLSNGARQSRVLTGLSTYVNSVSFDVDASRLVAASQDGRVMVWNVATGLPAHPAFVGHSGPAWDAWFTAADEVESIGEREVAVWSLAPRATLGLARPGPAASDRTDGSSVAVVDAGTVAVSTGDGSVYFRDVHTGRETSPPLRSGWAKSSEIALSPSHTKLALLIGDGSKGLGAPRERIAVWSLPDRRRIATLPAVNPFGNGLAFSPDERRIAYTASGVEGESTGVVRVVDAGTGAPAFPAIPADRDGVTYGVAYSADGEFLISGGQDAQARIWGTHTGLAIGTGGPYSVGPINAIAMNHAGSKLAVAAQDGQITLLDPRTRNPLDEPLSLGGPEPVAVAFSRDDRMIAVGASDGTVTMWDLPTRTLIAKALTGNSGSVTGLAFADDGRSLISIDTSGSLVVRDLEPGSWRAQACSIAGRNLTRAEWRQYMGNRSYEKTCAQWPDGP